MERTDLDRESSDPTALLTSSTSLDCFSPRAEYTPLTIVRLDLTSNSSNAILIQRHGRVGRDRLKTEGTIQLKRPSRD